MDPPEAADLDYLLGVGAPAAPPPPPPPPPAPVAPAVAAAAAAVPSAAAVSAGGGGGGGGGASSGGGGGATSDGAPASAASGDAGGGGVGGNSKKRPLEDKKARDRKRVLRNRELARVSNERRKGRIKAMENELTETRQTVSTLEESIRCLEAENKELRNLLQGKPAADGAGAGAPPPPGGGPPLAAPPQPGASH